MKTIATHAPSQKRRPRTFASILVVSALVGACSGGDSADPDTGGLTSPAGPGSGEPYLASAGEGLWMSWIEEGDGVHLVKVARHDGRQWTEPAVVASGSDFFVNWADFPALLIRGDTVVVHWLQRGGQGTYDYGVRLSWSVDGGGTWSPPWTPHEDDTPTEHGFVSYFAGPQGISAVWLDGREMVAHEGEGGPGPMTIRTRVLPVGGPPGPEVVLDAMTCECCQTDATVADGIPIVAYRDRSPGEVRNIHVARYEGGAWSAGRPVHDDGWVIGGCPVNGPALASDGPRVAVAWFTAPGEEAQVRLAFSEDRGASFGDPVRVDTGSPAGRVDLVSLGDGRVLVTWLERGEQGADVLSRVVGAGGKLGEVRTLAATSEGRASGFPRIALYGEGRMAVAWTDPAGPGQVHVADYALSEWD